MSLEMSMLFLKAIFSLEYFPNIPDKSEPAKGAAALAAKGNSIGSIPPFCLKFSFLLRRGPYFSVIAFTNS